MQRNRDKYLAADGIVYNISEHAVHDMQLLVVSAFDDHIIQFHNADFEVCGNVYCVFANRAEKWLHEIEGMKVDSNQGLEEEEEEE